jgi:HEAT repeat protein
VNRLKAQNDVDGLIRALRSPWTGAKAARAMGETGDDGTVEPLINALGDRREDIRKAAAEALGKLGDRRAVGPLSRTLNDNYASVRDQARRALCCIERSSAQNMEKA